MKLKSGFFTLTIIVFMCMSVVFSDRIRLDFRTSLERCLFIVVPSLYIFMILSCMLVSSGTCRLLGIPFRKFSENVLHIPSELFGIFVISLVGGYPTGAKLLCSMAENNQISYEDADKLSRICFCSGPAFICGVVGNALYGNVKIGIIVFVCILLGNILSAIVTAPFRNIRKSQNCKTDLKICFNAEIFTSSVYSSAKSVIDICGITLAFSAFTLMISLTGITDKITGIISAITGLNHEVSQSVILSVFEISNIATLPTSDYSLLPIICGLLSFGGICVLLQVSAISGGKLKIFPFLAVRLFSSLASSLFCLITMKFFPQWFIVNAVAFKAFSSAGGSYVPSVALLAMTYILLSSCKTEKITQS